MPPGRGSVGRTRERSRPQRPVVARARYRLATADRGARSGSHPRVAGPVASRALALLGAEVLRIDPPGLPEIAWQHLENGQGKRSALLDLRDAGGLER